MNAKTLSAAFILAASTLGLSVEAETILFSALPAPIQACASGGTCAPDTSSLATVGNATIFQMFDNLAVAPDLKYMVRYGLVAPSADAFSSNLTSSTVPVSGYLWLLVDNSYALASNAHAMTLYLDKLTPPPDGIYQGTPPFGSIQDSAPAPSV